MKCPYCQHEQADTVVFCSKCGQILKIQNSSINADNYWNAVNELKDKHDKDYIIKKKYRKSQTNRNKIKTIMACISFILIVTATLFIIKGVGNYNDNKLTAVKNNLPGIKLSYSYSKTETGFWIHYYYYTVMFNSDGTLNYYFLRTIGPAEKDELPSFEGTYTYTITRSLLGEYLLSFDNKSFTISVNNDDIPVSLSYNQ